MKLLKALGLVVILGASSAQAEEIDCHINLPFDVMRVSQVTTQYDSYGTDTSVTMSIRGRVGGEGVTYELSREANISFYNTDLKTLLESPTLKSKLKELIEYSTYSSDGPYRNVVTADSLIKELKTCKLQ